jgi:tetratricopeptide (TPR) repeat protein
MTASLLEQGISAAQTGRRDEARTLLAQVVETDEHNEQAWLWLAGLVDDPEDMRTCLENVLQLNPSNVKAQQGLAWVEQRYGKGAAIGATAVLDAPATAQPDQAAIAPQPQPKPAPAQQPDPSPILEIVAQPRPSDPCPYCGAATAPTDRRCPGCRQSLVERPESHAKRSKALSTLGWLWGIGGVFSLLGAALLLFMLLSLQRSGSFYGVRLAELNRAGVSIANLRGQALGGVGWGLFQLALARGLLGRRRWAWIVSTAIVVLQLLAGLCGVIFFAVVIRNALASLPGGGARSGSPISSIIFTLVLLIVFAPQILSLLLSFFSYADVFAPMRRLDTTMPVASPAQHYNNGLAYKNRGMWYMAAQEWTSAVRHAPYEPNFLHALGLAFVQLRQFDRARTVLDFARQVAPDDAQIADSRALVDREEKRKNWW